MGTYGIYSSIFHRDSVNPDWIDNCRHLLLAWKYRNLCCRSLSEGPDASTTPLVWIAHRIRHHMLCCSHLRFLLSFYLSRH